MADNILNNSNDELLDVNTYKIKLSPAQYDAIDNYLSTSSDPEQDNYRIASSFLISQRLNLPLDTVLKNSDMFIENETNLTSPITYDLNTYQAVFNSSQIGTIQYRNNFKKLELAKREYNGEDLSGSEEEAEIFRIDEELGRLADYTDRGTIAELLKATAMSSTYTMASSAVGFVAGTFGNLITPIVPGKVAITAILSKAASGVLNYENIQGQEYWELTRGMGMDKNAAKYFAKANAVLNSAIETALDSTLNKVTRGLTRGQIQSAYTKATTNMFVKGYMGGFGAGLVNFVKDASGEGLEEYLQSYVDVYTNYLAQEFMGMETDENFRSVFLGNFKNACKEGFYGFGSALIMGAPFLASDLKMSAKQAQASKAAIQLAPTAESATEMVSSITGLDKAEIGDTISKQWYKVQDEKAKNISADNLVKSDTEAIKLTRQTRAEALQYVSINDVEEVSTKHENAVRKAVEEKMPVSDKVLEDYADKDWAKKEIEYREQYPAVKDFYDANENLIAESKDFKDFQKKVGIPEMFDGDTDYMEWAYEKKKNELMIGTSQQKFISDFTTTHDNILKLKDEIRKYEQENENGKIAPYEGYWDDVDERLFALEKDSSNEEFEAVRQEIVKNPQGYMDALGMSQDQRLAKEGQSTYKSQFLRSESKYRTDTDEEIEDGKNPIEDLDDKDIIDSTEYLDAEEELASIESDIAEFSSMERTVITSDDLSDEELANISPKLLEMREKYAKAKAKKSKYQKKYDEAMAKLKETRSELTATYNKYKDAIKNLFKAGERVRKLEAEHKQLTDEYKVAQKELRQARNEYNKLAKATLKNRTAQVVKWKKTAHSVYMQDTMDAMRNYILGKGTLDPSLKEYFGDYYGLLANTPYDKLPLGAQQTVAQIATNINKIARNMLTATKANRMNPRYEISQAYSLQELGVELEADSTIGKQITEQLADMEFDAKEGTIQKIRNSQGKPKRLAKIFDGWREGVFTSLIDRLHDRDAECYANTDKRTGSAVQKMKDLNIKAKELHKPLISFKNENGKELVLSLEHAMGVYIYSQSPDFKKNIVSKKGNGIGKNVDAVIKAIPSNYRQFADYMLDTIGERTPEIAAEFERTTNEPFVYREGRYFPAFAKDPVIQKDIDILSMEEFVPNTVGHSFTERITGKTYAMDLNVVSNYFRSIAKQERYIAYNSWVKDMNYFMSEKGGIGTIIREKYGADAYSTMWDFVQDVANPSKKLDAADQLLNTVLNNYSKAVLAGNILTMLKQIPSIATYFRGDVGASFIISENVNFFTNMKEVTNFVKEKSPIMARRINSGYNFETSQFEEARNPLEIKGVEKVTNVMMKPISAVDLGVTIPMWKACYESEIAKGASERDAIRTADYLIEDTQPTSGTRNLSKAQRDSSPYKRMLTMFSNQIMNSQNEIFFDIPYYWKNKNYNKVAQIATSKLIAAAFMVAISAGAKNLGEDDEDKKKKNFGEEALKQLPVLLIPGWVGPQMSSVLGGYGSNSSLSILSTSANFMKNIASPNDDGNKGEKVLNSTVNLALDAVQTIGLPTVAGQRTFNAVKDIKEGEAFSQILHDIL